MLYTLVIIWIACAALVGISGLLNTLATPRYRSCLDYGESWRSKRQRARDSLAWRRKQDQAIFAAMNTALSARKESPWSSK